MPVIVNRSLLPTLSTLRDLLDIVSTLRDAANPFSSLDALHGAIALLVRMGTTLELNPAWLAWLQSISDDESLLDVLLAVGQYVEHLIEPSAGNVPSSPQTTGADVTIQAIDLGNWLAIIAEIVQLIGKLRGQNAA